eukprot:s5108_g4.t1
MYSWNESSVTNKKGEKSAMGWESSSTGAKGDFQKFDSMVMNWKIGIPLKSLGSGSGSSGSQAPLALMDADAPLKEDQWQVAQKQLIQAQDALNKKDVMTEIRKLKAEISHVYRFKELENGQELTLSLHNSLMKECGAKTESQDEILAGIKGQLAKRASREKK